MSGRVGESGMGENPNRLIAEATRVVDDCESYLEAASRLVYDIPMRRKAVEERIAAAREEDTREREKYHRALAEGVSVWERREAEIEWSRASEKLYRRQQELGSDDLDPENRKAVARQVAGLVREDSAQRLDAIAARSDDPEVQRTVAECKEQIARTTYQFSRVFTEAMPLQRDEVNKARAEAHNFLHRLKNPPVDQ